VILLYCLLPSTKQAFMIPPKATAAPAPVK
jgi:hypothetical protein